MTSRPSWLRRTPPLPRFILGAYSSVKPRFLLATKAIRGGCNRPSVHDVLLRAISAAIFDVRFSGLFGCRQESMPCMLRLIILYMKSSIWS